MMFMESLVITCAFGSCPLWQRQPGHPLLVKLRPPEGQTSGATSPTTTQTILPTRRTLLQVIPDLLHMIFVSDNLLSSDLLKPAYETKLSQTLDLGINYLLMLWPCIPAQVQTSGGKKTCTPGSGGDTRGTPAWKKTDMVSWKRSRATAGLSGAGLEVSPLACPREGPLPTVRLLMQTDSAANVERNAEYGREALNPGQAGWHTGWLSPGDAGFNSKCAWFGLRLVSLCPNALQIIDYVGSAWAVFLFFI
nr:uncharacterized protein LOC110361373 isoform X2 [Columba livia]